MNDSVELPNEGQSAPINDSNTPQETSAQNQPEISPAPQPAPQSNEEPAESPSAPAFEPAAENESPAPAEPAEQETVAEAAATETPQPEEPSAEEPVIEESGEESAENKHVDDSHDFHHDQHDDYDHQKESEAPEGNTIIVRYGVMGFMGEFRHNLAVPPTIGSKIVVRTERGVELGEVLMPVFRTEEGCNGCVRKITGEHLQSYLNECGSEFPFRRQGKVLRQANQQDIIDFRHLSHSADEAAKFCREHITKFKLNMKLVKVEHLLGGGRIVFYFTAEQRVDFRDLVKTLASQFRTRIEMRQVGARDEARLVADYERCGQRCCCQQFLKNLKPVSMKMAKIQKATLDPSKISGRCGRLMCCLRYEDEGYEELRKRLPRRGIWVKLEDGTIGRVVDTQIITQLVKLELPNREFEAVNVDEIVERDIPQPTEQELEELARKPRETKPATPVVAPVTYFSAKTMMEIDSELDENEKSSEGESEQPAAGEPSGEQGEEKRRRSKRRRPRKNRRPGQGQDGQNRESQQSQRPEGGSGEGGQPREKRSKHKRRHRRHKKPQGNNGGQQQNGSSGNTAGE